MITVTQSTQPTYRLFCQKYNNYYFMPKSTHPFETVLLKHAVSQVNKLHSSNHSALQHKWLIVEITTGHIVI